jgi:hypothetical protein
VQHAYRIVHTLGNQHDGSLLTRFSKQQRHQTSAMPFPPAAAAAASPRTSSEDMRASSFEAYQELRYYCLACRAENCVDLPQWHWGQVRIPVSWCPRVDLGLAVGVSCRSDTGAGWAIHSLQCPGVPWQGQRQNHRTRAGHFTGAGVAWPKHPKPHVTASSLKIPGQAETFAAAC